MGLYEFKESDAWDFSRNARTESRQKGDELQFKECPYCRGGKNRDNYSFAINLQTGQYKCLRSSCGVSGNMISLSKDFNFSLGTDVDVYYRKERNRYRKLKCSGDIVPKEPALNYLKGRGISEATAKRYQVTVQTGQETVLVFPFLDAQGSLQFVKYRKTDFSPGKDKNKEWCEPGCKPILFGMYQCNLANKRLILTEGQLDSLSVSEAGIENAVSVPTGALGFTWYPHCYDWLMQYKELIVFGDCEHGHITLVEDMKKRFQGKVKVIRQQDYQGCKDANELLMKHGAEAVRSAVQQAAEIPVAQVKELADVKSVDLFSMPRISTGIKSVDRVLSGGIYLGQTVILTGKRGEGKSTLGSQILANALEQEKNVFAYSGELPDYFFKKWLDFQIAGKHNVIERRQQDDILTHYIPKSKEEQITEWYRGRAYLYDNQAAGDEELQSLLHILEKAICQYGIDLVLLDNLMTALDIGMEVDLYRAQSKFVDKLVKMAKRLNVAVILVAHPRKNTFGGNDTDEVSGSSDITNKVDIVMTYKRKNDMLPEDRTLSISKNRLTGKLAVGDREICLKYDPASKRISEAEEFFTQPFGWEMDASGFVEVGEQMEVPF